MNTKPLLVLLVTIGLGSRASAQHFLKDYKRFLRQSPHNSRREQQAELTLLTEIFSAQHRKTGRSFNQVDTLHILLEAPSNSGERYLPYAGMLWNSSDTLAFALTYDLASHPVRHAVQFRPFMTSCRAPGGDCSRQALVRLIAGQHFDAAKQLAQANRELGGRYTQVVSATKTPQGYRIVSFILPAFMLPFTDALPFR